LALGEDPGARKAAMKAQAQARALGVPGAQVLAGAALAEADPHRRRDYETLMKARPGACRLAALLLVGPITNPNPNGRPDPPDLVVRCFGGFSITWRGDPVDLHVVKPRVRQMLRLLTLHAGHPLHRDLLIEALWPSADPAAAARYLHV